MKFSKNRGTSSYLKVDAVGSAGYEKASLAKILKLPQNFVGILQIRTPNFR